MDDGEKWCDTFEIIGISLLTAMHKLDIAGQLTTSSEFKDISIVVALATHFYNEFAEMAHDDDSIKWGRTLVGYIKKIGIPVEESSALGIDKFIKRVEKQGNKPIPALSAWTKKTNDRFSWNRKFKDFEEDHSKGGRKPGIGGQQYSIIHFTRAERAKYNFRNKDNLAKMSDKDLKDLQAGKTQIVFH
jgi:hypothetical protein